jgi:hypothetical protein
MEVSMHEEDEGCDLFFEVWKVSAETDRRTVRAIGPQEAAELIASEVLDEFTWQSSSSGCWCGHQHSDVLGVEALPVTYGVRSLRTGEIWLVDVGVVMEPRFVGTDLREVPMPPATHVVWGARVLCEDLRLADLSAWPDGQQRVTLSDVHAGAKPPADACVECWARAPGFVDGLLQIGRH